MPPPSCQELDAAAGSFPSNIFNAHGPLICLDDFVSQQTGELERVEVVGGMWDVAGGAPADFANLKGFHVEVYEAREDGGVPCGGEPDWFIENFGVSIAETMPLYHSTDAQGVKHYTFTIEALGGIQLEARERYYLGVYGVPADGESPELFVWGAADGEHGLTSFSMDTDTGERLCNGADLAFCVDSPKPCFADFNADGGPDTRDLIDFLRAWSAGDLASDMDASQSVDSRDVTEFLGVWQTPCAE